jgi:hypothetical protein
MVALGAGLLWCEAAARAEVQWIVPSAEELAMTSEPKAPGAPAVVLSYEQSDDGETAERTIHVRIKVLTDGGISAGNIEIFSGFVENVSRDFLEKFQARTIHADGTVIPYAASSTSTIVEKSGIRAIALPQVQVGSILEYVVHYAGGNTLYTRLVRYYEPDWRLQGKYFTRSAHFTLKVPERLEKDSTRWVANLPPGAALQRTKNRVDLDVKDIPALPDEPDMPPMSSTAYSVRFFYYDQSRDKFWGDKGGDTDYFWSEFDKPTKTLQAVVHDLVIPTDNDETKLHKLYDAVQKFENTDLTRERTHTEDVKNNVHEANNSDDVWGRKRGDNQDLTLLFIALARSAGYQAYPMAVASRGRAVFDQNVLSWDQLDSMVAIVVVNGHEVYFDPGTKMCPFAHMAPWHSNVVGVSTEAKLVKIRMTPTEPAKGARTERMADLMLMPNGDVSGKATITWSENAALRLRQKAIRDDEHAVKRDVEKEVQGEVPPGVEVKLESLEGLDNADVPLVATLAVSGKMGQATRKRIVLPSQFFASTGKPVFVGDIRTQPIAFPEAYTGRDKMRLRMPAGYVVESLPDGRSLATAKDSGYASNALPAADDGSVIVTQRAFSLNRVDYKVDEYRGLRQYFQQVADYDQDQIILKVAQGGGDAAASVDAKP